MKTDRFTDSIRRKLESIRPEFTEKDWTRLQATLDQASPPQPGTHQPGPSGQPVAGGGWLGRTLLGQPWMMAAAAVSTVALVGVTLWQRNEINQLRHTVQQLNQQPANRPAPVVSDQQPVASARPDVQRSDAQPPNAHPNERSRTDTVYITRYVGVPERARPTGEVTRQSNRPIQNPSSSHRRNLTAPYSTGSGVAQRPAVPPERYAVTPAPSPESIALRPTNPTVNSQPKNYDGLYTSRTSNQPVTNPADQSVRSNATPKPLENHRISPPTRTPDNPVAAGNLTVADAGASTQPNGLFTAYAPVAGRPLALQAGDWNEALDRRAKRLRPVRPTPVVESAPVSQPVERVATRFRLGVGTELHARLWSVGAFSEVLLGRHWTLGLGLSRATYMGGLFLTDDDFYMRTKRNFRKDYAPGVGPGRDILNIDTRMVRFQVPLSLGYRVPLNQALTLLPTVGTYLNLSNTEHITYYYREPQRGFDKANVSAGRPVDLATNLAFGTSLEWQRGHWLAQAGPVVTLPLQTSAQPQPNWYSTPVMGVRVRALYQF